MRCDAMRSRAASPQDLVIFSVMFFVVYIGFAMAFFLTYSAILPQYACRHAPHQPGHLSFAVNRHALALGAAVGVGVGVAVEPTSVSGP